MPSHTRTHHQHKFFFFSRFRFFQLMMMTILRTSVYMGSFFRVYLAGQDFHIRFLVLRWTLFLHKNGEEWRWRAVSWSLCPKKVCSFSSFFPSWEQVWMCSIFSLIYLLSKLHFFWKMGQVEKGDGAREKQTEKKMGRREDGVS